MINSPIYTYIVKLERVQIYNIYLFMIDNNTYRIRIGLFSLVMKNKLKSKIAQQCGYTSSSSNSSFYMLMVIYTLLVFILPISTSMVLSEPSFMEAPVRPAQVVNHNFQARYLYGNIQKQKGIINMHLNVRSLRSKVMEIKNLIKIHNPHIFGVSETELNKDRVLVESLKIQGYDLLFPQSWSKYGFARVVVYVKKSFKYTQVSELEDDRVQSVWIKGGYDKSKGIYFCHGYREHLSGQGSNEQQIYLNKFLDQWEAACYHGGTVTPNEVHVSGDINIDVFQGKWLRLDYPLLPLSKMIKNFCHLNNFYQLVEGITRAQYNSVNQTTDISCIDHVYTNARFRCSNPTILSFGDSDHDLIKYTRYSKIPFGPTRTMLTRSYKNFKKDAFLEEVASVDWYDVYSCSDVDMAVETFTNKFRFILNNHAPWVKFQQKQHFKPWITEDTKNLMKLRDDWKQAAKELPRNSPDQTHAWAEFKKYRNRVNNKKRHDECNYKAEKINEVSDTPNLLWKYAKSFMGWTNQGPPHQIEIDNNLLTSAKKISESMNEYFIGKVNKIRAEMNHAEFPTGKLQEFMSGKNCRMQLQHVSLEKVRKILKNLSSSRSTAIDELNNYSLKIAADFVVSPIHHIICLSVIQNKFPDKWKCSKIIPVHKKGDKTDRKNYRPVAILSPISKVLEKVLYEQIYSYFSRNNLFHSNLHGYRKHRSTQTALLQVYDRWVRAAHEGKLSGVVLLDLSAAFDLVDSDLLLKKLQIYGFDNDILYWIRSYLVNRYQAVWIDHVLSNFLHCEAGVPQGSNLGPLLFLIFYNDLPLSVSCSLDAYADDSTMTVSGATVDEISRSLTENCETVNCWMKGNKLKLNVDKTHLLVVGTSARLRLQDSSVSTHMDGIELQESSNKHEMLLGCYVQQDLKWDVQVDYVLKRLQQRLAALHKLGNKISFNLRCQMAESVFTSVLTYCLPVFGGCSQGDIESLQVMQNSAARFVTQCGRMTNRKLLLCQTGWLSVRQLIQYHTALCTFRVRESLEPEYLGEILVRDNRVNKIIIPNSNLTLAKKSFCFRGAEEWNKLPESIRSLKKVGPFKSKLKQWIRENVPPFG